MHGRDGQSGRKRTSEKAHKKRKSSVRKRQIIEELRKENEILREKIKITESYAKNVEDHFRE